MGSVDNIEHILKKIYEYKIHNNIQIDNKSLSLSEYEINRLPKLKENWKWVAASDVCSFITNGVHSPTSIVDELRINKKMLRITDLNDTKIIDFKKLPYCARFIKSDYDKTLKKGDIYISFTGNILGKRFYVEKDNDNIVFAHYFVRLHPIIVNSKYVYYSLLSKYFDQFMNSHKLGSTQPNLKVTDLKRIPIPLAPLEEQQEIVDILSPIAEKIELNNRINKTLEDIAQLLYKQWFIDFEFPNKDGKSYKSSGGKMVYNEELDKEIPEGWKSGIISQICTIGTGKRPTSNNGNIPIIGANGITGYSDKFSHQKVVVTGRVGTIGNVRRYTIPVFCSDNLIYFESDNNWFNIVYIILKNFNYEDIKKGSTQPLINQGDLKNIKIAIPNNELIGKMSSLLEKLFSQIDELQKQIVILNKYKEILLTKYFGGE